MLGRIVCRIAGKRLWIDYQPRFPRRWQHVARMQIGCEQHLPGRRVRQLLEEAQTLTDESRIGLLLDVGQGLLTEKLH